MRAIIGCLPGRIKIHTSSASYIARLLRSQWVSPNTEKEALEFRILVAELDHRNYSSTVDPTTGKQAFAFAYPPEIAAAIAAFEQDRSRLKQALTFPRR
jgi:hypothetical protein